MNAAGPLASLLAVVSGLALVRFSRNRVLKQMALVLALISSMLMSIYYLRAASRMGGDEYFVARQLNVPRHVVDIPFGAAFAICFVLAVRALGDWRTRLKWLGVILVGSVPTGIALMIANGWVRAEVNRSSPFFRPALGFSFPVVLVDAIALLALWIWWGWANTRQGVT